MLCILLASSTRVERLNALEQRCGGWVDLLDAETAAYIIQQLHFVHHTVLTHPLTSAEHTLPCLTSSLCGEHKDLVMILKDGIWFRKDGVSRLLAAVLAF